MLSVYRINATFDNGDGIINILNCTKVVKRYSTSKSEINPNMRIVAKRNRLIYCLINL